MAWIIVKYTQDILYPNETNRYYLTQGDIIKFGRVRFRLRKLHIEDDYDSSEDRDEAKDSGASQDHSHNQTDDENAGEQPNENRRPFRGDSTVVS